ncbi:MAG: 3'-5' exonuclease [Gammaproteobacteria bacterium]|nr:3'-5' exonuclease [Gammaproteobacteria bacterium]
MRLPFQRSLEARRTRRALPPAVRDGLRLLRIRARERIAEERWSDSGLLSLARFVALDLETTGPNMHADRIISIGAVAVAARAIRHDDAFEVVVRQERESGVDNILIHQIGGQEQRGGADPVGALVSFLRYLDGAVAVAFRAEFDATVLERELRAWLGIRVGVRFLDLAAILPALLPGTPNDSLDDWARHCGLPPIGRHHAIADAYANAQLLLIALERAQRLGLTTTADLIALEKSQRWLGRRR